MTFWKTVLAVALGGLVVVGSIVAWHRWIVWREQRAQEVAVFAALEMACEEAQIRTDLVGLAACAKDFRRIEESAHLNRFWETAGRRKAVALDVIEARCPQNGSLSEELLRSCSRAHGILGNQVHATLFSDRAKEAYQKRQQAERAAAEQQAAERLPVFSAPLMDWSRRRSK